MRWYHGLHTTGGRPAPLGGKGEARARDVFEGVAGLRRLGSTGKDGAISARRMNWIAVRGDTGLPDGGDVPMERGLFPVGVDRRKEGVTGPDGSGVCGAAGGDLAL